jgi:hypothetical protein
LSLAHVNSYINHLLDLFKSSSSDDFQLIGNELIVLFSHRWMDMRIDRDG